MANELGSEWPAMEWLYFYIIPVITFLLAWRFSFQRSKRRPLPPGPFQFPILGNLHLLLGGLPHQTLATLSLKYGPLMSVRLGSTLALVVSTADAAKEFLKTHDRVFASRPATAAAEYLSYNYSDIAYAPYGPSWRHLRKLCVLQLLSSRRIEQFRSIREEEVSAMIRSLIKNSDSGVSNITKTASNLTNSIICRMAFGRKYFDEDLIGGSGIDSVIKEIFMLVGSFNIGDYIPFLAPLDLQGLNSRFKEIQKTHDYLLEKIINEHVLEKKKPNAMPDLVDVLLAASADETMEFKITRDNIKTVINDVFLAGTDTASTTIEWTMSELMRNRAVLKKLQEETGRVAGVDRLVQESDLSSLVYLRAVVNEAFRLHPPASLSLPHISVEDCTVLGYEIPKGTRLLINLWAIGRNPKSWGEDAESFKPERFMEDGFMDSKVENFEWIPFGAGRRGCPGQQLGMLLVEFAVAQLVHCFNWSLPNGQELDMTEKFNGIILPREHELLAVLTPRLPILMQGTTR
eukprot:PITA_08630